MLQRFANLAQIISMFPALYGAYGAWVTLHPSKGGEAVNIQPIHPGYIVSLLSFAVLLAVGGVMQFASRRKRTEPLNGHGQSVSPGAASSAAEIDRLNKEIARLMVPWTPVDCDREAGYEIDSAWLSVPHRPGIDVTSKVRQIVASGRAGIPVSTHELLGHDIHPGVLKQLKVTFSIVRSEGKEIFVPDPVPRAFGGQRG